MRGLLFLHASVGWGLGLRVVQPQESFNTAGGFVLNIEDIWEPGTEQWVGMLEKAESNWEVAAGDQKCHWQGRGVSWGRGPLLQVSHQISMCKW